MYNEFMKLERQIDAANDALIKAGRGHELTQDILSAPDTDILAQQYAKPQKKFSELCLEMKRQFGPTVMVWDLPNIATTRKRK